MVLWTPGPDFWDAVLAVVSIVVGYLGRMFQTKVRKSE